MKCACYYYGVYYKSCLEAVQLTYKSYEVAWGLKAGNVPVVQDAIQQFSANQRSDVNLDLALAPGAGQAILKIQIDMHSSV